MKLVILPRLAPTALAVLAAVAATTKVHSASSDDPRDMAVVADKLKTMLESEATGSEAPWTNPATGNHGWIRIERTYYLSPDTPCRDYSRSTVDQSGVEEEVIGTGCRLPDARWYLDEAIGGPGDVVAVESDPAPETTAEATATPALESGPEEAVTDPVETSVAPPGAVARPPQPVARPPWAGVSVSLPRRSAF